MVRRLQRLIHGPAWLGWLAIASGLAVVISIAVAQGRSKTYFALVGMSAAFTFSTLSCATRLKSSFWWSCRLLCCSPAPCRFRSG